MIRYRFATSIRDFTNDDVESIHRLLAQLSSNTRTLSLYDLKVIASKNHFLLAITGDAIPDETIIGMATLVPIMIPTCVSGRIEDVVVSEDFRGQGIGRELTLRLIHEAQASGWHHVDLTSHPRRVEANKLYQSLGFERRETNIYRLDLKP